MRSSPLQKTIAVVRILIGIIFILFGQYKLFTYAFAHGGFEQYISGYVQGEAVGFYKGILSGIVLPHPVLFGYMVGFVELGRKFASPTTRKISGAWPPPAPSV